MVSIRFRLTCSCNSAADCSPIRDTVSSIGAARGISLPETTTGMRHVCIFRHALALDERRVKFLPEYVNGGLGPINASRSERMQGGRDVEEDQSSAVDSSNSDDDDMTQQVGGNVKEVWFSGTHSDM